MITATVGVHLPSATTSGTVKCMIAKTDSTGRHNLAQAHATFGPSYGGGRLASLAMQTLRPLSETDALSIVCQAKGQAQFLASDASLIAVPLASLYRSGDPEPFEDAPDGL